MRYIPMDNTTFVPWPLLCAAETSVFRVLVAPESHEMPDDEFGVANAAREKCQFSCTSHALDPPITHEYQI